MANSWADGLHPQLKPYFIALFAEAQRHDPAARITSAKRSRSEQARLYRRYQEGLIDPKRRTLFPAAPPGTSYHEFGRAIDMVARPEVLVALGAAWTRIGGKWGGERDPIHFQA